jgi:hypothetical protein
MKLKTNQRFKFYFYISRGLATGIGVLLFADSEKLASAKLKKLLEGEYSLKLQKVEERE